MDGAVARPVPHFRNAARSQVSADPNPATGSMAMTPEQRRRNKIAGLVLLVFVIAVFAWTVFRGSALLAGKAIGG